MPSRKGFPDTQNHKQTSRGQDLQTAENTEQRLIVDMCMPCCACPALALGRLPTCECRQVSDTALPSSKVFHGGRMSF